jgi:small subunit ribosomal protein S3
MGHKVNPNGFRLGVTTHWTSNWYAERAAYGDTLNKDIAVRSFLRKKLAQASVSRIQIDRPAKSARVTIHTARPGIIIGKKGEDIEKLRVEVAQKMGLKPDVVHISVEEIRKPEIDAQLIAESVAQQLERRIMFRRAMKRAVQNAMRQGAQGIKIQVGGRLNGAEIARTEWYREGRVPLHTLRAYVDYATAEAKTTYGVIGVKVWVFNGEVFEADRKAERSERKDEAGAEATA